MIYGFIHQGSGIGNQLHRYVATRVKSKELGTDWRMIYNPDNSGKKEGFKADNFLPFDKSRLITELPGDFSAYEEKKVIENGVDIRSYDPEFNFIQDNTVIDGEFQDERYWQSHAKDVDEWLKTEPLDIPDDVCVIGFRGGEFSVFSDLFLPPDYWQRAIEEVLAVNDKMRFEVHTDDPQSAQAMFGQIPIHSNPSLNWRSMRYAKYAIIANSSFFIFPRWLNRGVTIAPRYWARHNTKTWALPQNFYKRFTYIE